VEVTLICESTDQSDLKHRVELESCAAANGAIDLLSNQRNATEGLQVFKA